MEKTPAPAGLRPALLILLALAALPLAAAQAQESQCGQKPVLGVTPQTAYVQGTTTVIYQLDITNPDPQGCPEQEYEITLAAPQGVNTGYAPGKVVLQQGKTTSLTYSATPLEETPSANALSFRATVRSTGRIGKATASLVVANCSAHSPPALMVEDGPADPLEGEELAYRIRIVNNDPPEQRACPPSRIVLEVAVPANWTLYQNRRNFDLLQGGNESAGLAVVANQSGDYAILLRAFHPGDAGKATAIEYPIRIQAPRKQETPVKGLPAGKPLEIWWALVMWIAAIAFLTRLSSETGRLWQSERLSKIHGLLPEKLNNKIGGLLGTGQPTAPAAPPTPATKEEPKQQEKK